MTTNHFLRRLKSLERERAKGWEITWRNLSRLFAPFKSRFLDSTGETPDGSRENLLYDNVGVIGIRNLTNGLHSGLTSPARPWFSLTVSDKRLAGTQAVKEWLDAVERVLYDTINNRSNFYEKMTSLYEELGVFGTAVMFIEPDDPRGIRCRTLTAGEYFLDVNASGVVDTIYRRVHMTPRQMVDKWPETVPRDIRDMAENDRDEWLTVLHAVEPNPDFQPGEVEARRRPFRSVYLRLTGAQDVLEEGGYYEFPAICPRWSVIGNDVYGRSPAMDALSNCRLIQKMAQSGILALEKKIGPPLIASQNAGFASPIDVSPNAVNYVSSLNQGANAVVPLYQFDFDLKSLEFAKEEMRAKIKETLYNDLFLMISQINRNITATEVAERNAEKMLLVGPVIDRLISEGHRPLIQRVFGIVLRQGQLPQAPPGLKPENIKVELISFLAQAQKRAGLEAVQNTVAFIGQLAALMPGAVDKLNVDEAIDEVADINGAPPNVIRSTEEVAKLRQEREAEAQGQAQMGALKQGVDMAAVGAKAAKDLGLAGGDQEGGEPDDVMAALAGLLPEAAGGPEI